MLSYKENELITRIGPGTPAGQLLRRYWHPIAVAKELTAEHPAKFVRVLGEDLVLFRAKDGRLGLLEDRCAHRGASLSYGRVEERGIACAYHGWLYDIDGNCLECPAEAAGSNFHRTVTQKAYIVQEHVNLVWAYMGPAPAPVLTHYDTLFRRDGHRTIVVHPTLDCNWFQAMENSVDPAHLQILHQEYYGRGARKPVNTTRGYTDDVAHVDFYLTDQGIMKQRTYANGVSDEHPLLFPTILRQGPSTQIRTPIDDEHTMHIHVLFVPTEDGSEPEDAFDPPVKYTEPYKQPPNKLHPEARFTLQHIIPQDHMAWETQGPIADRTRERLSTSDRGVTMLRDLMQRELAKIERGEDPMAVYRDPDHAIIDTNVDEGVRQMKTDARADGQTADVNLAALYHGRGARDG
ncbi:MAG TPA: Rieske 2Fe-2S domain-containing protein [Verrucomicrobiae bacterium]|jgi:5,5'-dehydrodivanillate O-demethylase oxygenase subunit|nr:Rieske 2Fe-2S domain-containing protein [Verrucomicrobiae bacterium]